MTSVENIELIDCAISEIDPEAFYSLDKLNFLNLSRNKIVDFTLVKLPVNLENLDISHNETESIDGGFGNAKQSLKANKLKELTAGSFSKLAGLKCLNLAENDLNVIPDEAFNGLVNLKELDLHKTGVKVISACLFCQHRIYTS